MWELDYKESWTPKNWCFWTVVLEETLESPFDCQEIQPVHPKGNQSWIFIGRIDVEAETPILWPSDAKSWPFEKTLMLGKIEGKGSPGGGIGRGDHFLPHKFIKRTFECWANSTKQLLNAGRGHQAPRKAAYCLWKEVGQTIKDKKRDKRGRDGDSSQEGSLKKERIYQTPGNTLTSGSVASLGISEGNITGKKNN